MRCDAEKHKVLDLRGALAEAGVRQAHGLDQRTPQAEASEGVQGEHTQGRAGEAEKALDWRLIKNPLRAAGTELCAGFHR